MAEQNGTQSQRDPSKTGVEYGPALSLAKGGGAIRGIGEKFSVNPVNGTGAFSLPIFVTPSRSDFYPNLSLSYDSGSGNGPFGLGWNLSLPSIARKTDKGLPQYRDEDDSDIFILSNAEDLVPVLIQQGDGWRRDRRTVDQDGRTYTVERYRPRVEGLFARIERWRDQATNEAFWLSISKDNVTSLYGRSSDRRVRDPEDHSRIFKWLLEESRDDKGNVILYEYKPENADSVDISLPQEGNRLANAKCFSELYLKRVKYGKKAPGPQDDFLFQVVFDYGEHDLDLPTIDEVQKWPCRQDSFSTFRACFEIRTFRLCRRVMMFHDFQELGTTPCLVRSTDFTYVENPIASYLASATQIGYLRDNDAAGYKKASFPSLEFTYSSATVDPEVHFVDAESLRNLPIGLDAGKYQWIDLDSEGITGILTQQSDAWFYKRNYGNAQFGPEERVANFPSLSDTASSRQQVMDLTGDGEKCLVQFSAPFAGYFERDESGQWGPFTVFASNPNVSWSDPNLRLIDLDGDGFSDILITEDDTWSWYPSQSQGGFAAPQSVRAARDEESGPALVFADPAQSVFLADMSGDGLTDIVRIRNGEVCYWPNLGYGRFGAKIPMDGAPVFDHEDLFEPRRIRLADIDGSGTIDIIYLGRESVTFWSNQSGNSWSDGTVLENFPRVDELDSVSVVDLLGTGTACIVWSSPSLEDANRPMRYIDLMSGQKPHLLVSVSNNLGMQTVLQYATSSKFYLEDMLAGTPWITKLPFPVHVVETAETRDLITGTKLVTTYKYHHGFYDGIEREFRGFGMVEQWDTQEFALFAGLGLFASPPNTGEQELHVPPVHTKTWFHTGAFFDQDNITRQFAGEYYAGDPLSWPLSDANLPPGLTSQEEEEARRALKGMALRQEVYADDGSENSSHPYSVSEHAFAVRLIQPGLSNPHAVFLTYETESLDYHYERNPADPRIRHQMTLEIDDFGNAVKSATVAYRRRAPQFDEQAQARVTYSEKVVSNLADEAVWYRVGVPVESRTYELTGLAASTTPFALSAILGASANAAEIPYEARPNPALVQKRMLEFSRSLYLKDNLSGPLPVGEVESLALPYESYKLVFTPGLLAQVYGDRLNDNLLRDNGKYLQGKDLKNRQLFKTEDDDNTWWILSGRSLYAPDASQRFYLPNGAQDALGNVTTFSFDPYALAIIQTEDALGNTISAQINYRTIQPWMITDANGNRSAVRFDVLGMVVATAVMGKEGASEGDILDTTTPESSPADDPTTKFEYDLFNWSVNQRPNVVHVLAREIHRDPATRWQESFTYSDGFGREIQKKVQAEPGRIHEDDPNAPVANPRWVGTGRTVFDNKGNPVKKYEPFFSIASDYEDEQSLVEQGVTPLLHYDPLSRLIQTDLPDGTLSRVEFDPWQQTTWDQNDTVLESRWYADRGSPDPNGAEPSDPSRRAAWLAAKHANTPVVAHLDTLGRPFLTVANNGPDGHYQIRVELDITGVQRSVTDALGRKVMTYDYDMLGTRIHQNGVDAGERWTLNNAAGKTLNGWDGRGHFVSREYDALLRPTALFVSTSGAPKVMAEGIVYGESLSDPSSMNLRERTFQQFDAAGVVTNHGFDFKGNLLSSSRQLLQNYRDEVDWSTSQILDNETFSSSATYDALNRAVTITAPEASIIRPTYNEANLLERLDVKLRGSPALTPFVTNLDYNAKGQRELCEYGNGSSTTYAYDPETFRMTALRTTRTTDNAVLQDLSYAYDPVGNITAIADQAQQTVFFNNSVVTASSQYVYDAIYRLLQANGREHAGQAQDSQPEYDWNDSPRVGLPQPGDGQAMRGYLEQYKYDSVGNILTVVHQADNGNWTRRYAYDTQSNRLLSTSLPGDATTAPYSAKCEYDAHGNMTRMLHLPLMQWNFKDQLQATSQQVVNSGTPETTYYVYDATGQRVRKVTEQQAAGGQQPARMKERVYLGGFEIYREYQSDGTVGLQRETLHVMDDKRRVAIVETKSTDASAPPNSVPSTLVRYQLDNHLGSACVELDDAAALISYEEYYPYGSTSYQAGRSAAEVSLKRYRYTGKERDEETGLSYHGARYYATWLGRWTACDPAGMVDGPDLYAYVRGNPIRLSDPNGREATTTYLGSSKDNKYVERLEKTWGGNQYWSDTGSNGAGWYVRTQGNRILAAPPRPGQLYPIQPGDISYGLEWQRPEKLGEPTYVSNGEGGSSSVENKNQCKVEVKATGAAVIPFGNLYRSLGGGDLPEALDQVSLVPGAKHLFVVHTDSYGKQTGYRAGPSVPMPGNWGLIKVEMGSYTRETLFPDWDPRAPSITVISGSEACDKNLCFRDELDRIGDAKVPYQALGPNSNSVARTLLEKCGIEPKKPQEVLVGEKPGAEDYPGQAAVSGKGQRKEDVFAPGWNATVRDKPLKPHTGPNTLFQ